MKRAGFIGLCIAAALLGCEGSETAPVLPVISEVAPLSGKAGARIAIRGSGFGRDISVVEVRFDVAVAKVESISPSEIQALVPVAAQSGTIKVRVDGNEVEYATPFTVEVEPKVVFGVSAIVPLYGESGTGVTIKGTRFGEDKDALEVKFARNVQANILSISDKQINTQVPEGAVSGNISVKLGDKEVVFSTPFQVVTAQAPFVITKIEPTSGPPKTVVTLTGRGFGTDADEIEVHFGSVEAMITAITQTEIQTSVPVGGQTAKILLTKDGTTVASPTEFSVTGIMVITKVEPNTASVGAEITITGRGFGEVTSALSLKFHDNVTATISALSDTQIVTSVPEGAVTGRISITKDGRNTTMSPSAFTVTTGG